MWVWWRRKVGWVKLDDVEVVYTVRAVAALLAEARRGRDGPALAGDRVVEVDRRDAGVCDEGGRVGGGGGGG